MVIAEASHYQCATQTKPSPAQEQVGFGRVDVVPRPRIGVRSDINPPETSFGAAGLGGGTVTSAVFQLSAGLRSRE